MSEELTPGLQFVATRPIGAMPRALGAMCLFACLMLWSNFTYAIGPVRIIGNHQLRSAPGVLNAKAAGTAEDPLIISGLNIDAELSGPALILSKTDLHVVLENCNITRGLGNAVVIHQASNVRLRDFFVSDTYAGFGNFPAQSGQEANAIRIDKSRQIVLESSVKVENVYPGAGAAGAPVAGLQNEGGDGATGRFVYASNSDGLKIDGIYRGVWGSAGGAQGFNPGNEENKTGRGGDAEAILITDSQNVSISADIAEVRGGAGAAGAAGTVRGGAGGVPGGARGIVMRRVSDAAINAKVSSLWGAAAGAGGSSLIPETHSGAGTTGGSAVGLLCENCLKLSIETGTSIENLRAGAGSTAAVNLTLAGSAETAPSGDGGSAIGMMFENSTILNFADGVRLANLYGAAGAAGVMGAIGFFGYMAPGGAPGDGGDAIMIAADKATLFNAGSAAAIDGLCKTSCHTLHPARAGMRGAGGFLGLDPIRSPRGRDGRAEVILIDNQPASAANLTFGHAQSCQGILGGLASSR